MILSALCTELLHVSVVAELLLTLCHDAMLSK